MYSIFISSFGGLICACWGGLFSTQLTFGADGHSRLICGGEGQDRLIEGDALTDGQSGVYGQVTLTNGQLSDGQVNDGHTVVRFINVALH